MQKLKWIIFSLLFTNLVNGQIANFENISLDRKNMVQASVGLDMAVMTKIEYSRVVNIRQKLFLLSGGFTMPFGDEILDDFKLALHISGRLAKKNNWQVPFHIGVFNTSASNKFNQNSTVGAHVSVNPGYYKKTWFAAAEITYDKFILSYIKSSDFYREAYFAEVKDGWYKNTGGNFHFGVMGGKTFKNSELNFKMGLILTERLNTILVPYYARIGYRFMF